MIPLGTDTDDLGSLGRLLAFAFSRDKGDERSNSVKGMAYGGVGENARLGRGGEGRGRVVRLEFRSFVRERVICQIW